MKKIKRPISLLLSVLMVVSLFTIVPLTASAATTKTVSDTLTKSKTSGTGLPTEWNCSFTGSGESGAAYDGKSGGGVTDYMYIGTNTQKKLGFVTTQSGGTAVSITLNWGNNLNVANKHVVIFGKDTPYSSHEDIFDRDKRGEKFADISVASNSTQTVSLGSGYKYIALRTDKTSGGQADIRFDSIIINWQQKFYKVTWNNWDGATLETDAEVPEGTTPTYNGATPTKPQDAENTYTFSGWSPTVSPATKDITYTAQFTATKRKYTVTWKNGDNVLETDTNVEYGTLPTYNGAVPAKAATAQYTYTFSGWNDGTKNYALNEALPTVTGDVTFTANFSETVNKYTVTWKNGDDVIETDTEVEYGTLPTYNGAVPTKTATAQYTYTFSGWNDGTKDYALNEALPTVTGDVTFTANFSETVNKYTVTWKNGDDVIETDTEVEYGTLPTYDGAVPTKTATAQYTYTFSGWNDGTKDYALNEALPTVTGDVTFTANFSETVNKYTVTWKNGDDVIETDTEVEYGALPTYNGAVPTKTATAQYSYTFSGWNDGTKDYALNEALPTVTGDVTFTANFSETVNKYTVTWKNGNDVIETDTEVPYGTTASYNGAEPTKAATAQYTYTFDGWNVGTTFYAPDQLPEVTGDVTFTAHFTETVNKYKVTWDNQGVIREDTLDYGSKPSYGSTPTKAATAQYTYTFAGWSDGTMTYDPNAELPAVEGNVTYTATFSETVNKYTVTWKNGNDVIETDTEVPYGTTASYNGAEPTKAATAQYTYTFDGWNVGTTFYAPDQLPEVTGDVTFTAHFTETVNRYKVTWDNQGVIREDTLDYGSKPSYGSTPTKTATAQYTYTFAGWSDGTTTYDPNAELPAVEGNVTYTATFSETVNKYTVTWKNGNDVIETDTDVEYGALPHYDGAVPTKADDEQYTYTFSGWNDGTKDYALNEALPTVTGEVTYTATFTQNAKAKFFAGQTITLKDEIYVNFYIDPTAAGVELTDITEGDKTLTVNFSWVTSPAPKSDVSKCSTVISKDNFNQIGNYLVVSCRVCAAEMSCIIKATGTIDNYSNFITYSVREYGETVLDPNSEFSVDYKEKNGEQKYNDLVDLIKKTLDYGTKAQVVFNINVSEPANSVVSGYAMGDVTTAMIDEAIYAANGKYADDMNTVANALGAKYYGSSLFYLSNNKLRHIFTKNTAAFKPNDYDGNQYNYYYYVEKGGIPAAQLDMLQEFTVGSVTFYYSPLDYAKAVIGSGLSQNEKNLAKSLYWYNESANRFFGQ